jgi:hypothetical protein
VWSGCPQHGEGGGISRVYSVANLKKIIFFLFLDFGYYGIQS